MHLLLRNRGDGRVWILKNRKTVFGKEPSCHVPLQGGSAADRHAYIHITDEACQIEDLGSPWGTLVNGYRAAGYYLASGDLIQLGGDASFELTVSMADEPAHSCGRCGLILEIEAAVASATSSGMLCSRCAAHRSRNPKGASERLPRPKRPLGSSADTMATGRYTAVPGLPLELSEGYDVIQVIGEGGQGRVFKLRTKGTGQLVAAKQLTSVGTRSRQRFIREARSLSMLQHPNIVRLIEVIDAGSGPVLVMAFVDGPSLDTLASAKTRPEPARVADLGHQTASALAYVARQGIIHRDVKPSNILVSPGDVAVLTDFGFVSSSEGEKLTVSGAWIGTPHYISPEQLQPKAVVDNRSDVWGLGVTLYEVLTGVVPFDAENLHAIFARILMTPPPLDALYAAAGPELAGVVLRLLEKDPAKRPTPEEAEELLAPWKR